MYVAATKCLTHQGAKRMAAVAVEVEHAQTAGIAIAVAVADSGGHLMVLERMDGGRFQYCPFSNHQGRLRGLEQATDLGSGRASAAA